MLACSPRASVSPERGECDREWPLSQIESFDQGVRFRHLPHVAAYRRYITRRVELPHPSHHIAHFVGLQHRVGVRFACHNTDSNGVSPLRTNATSSSAMWIKSASSTVSIGEWVYRVGYVSSAVSTPRRSSSAPSLP